MDISPAELMPGVEIPGNHCDFHLAHRFLVENRILVRRTSGAKRLMDEYFNARQPSYVKKKRLLMSIS